MEKNKKNEELQSRREFFKRAAKGALPILGAIVLANAPIISKATEATSCTQAYCTTSCVSGCYNGCKFGCKTNCYHSCSKVCGSTCKGGSYGH